MIEPAYPEIDEEKKSDYHLLAKDNELPDASKQVVNNPPQQSLSSNHKWPITIGLIILALAGILTIAITSSVHKQNVREQDSLNTVSAEAKTAISMLQGTNISKEGTRDNCVMTGFDGNYNCSYGATFTVNMLLQNGKIADGWASSDGGQTLHNSKYPDCYLSKWDGGLNNFFISCSISFNGTIL